MLLWSREWLQLPPFPWSGILNGTTCVVEAARMGGYGTTDTQGRNVNVHVRLGLLKPISEPAVSHPFETHLSSLAGGWESQLEISSGLGSLERGQASRSGVNLLCKEHHEMYKQPGRLSSVRHICHLIVSCFFCSHAFLLLSAICRAESNVLMINHIMFQMFCTRTLETCDYRWSQAKEKTPNMHSE